MIDKLKEKIQNFDDRQKKLFETSVFMAKMVGAGAVFHIILLIYPSTIGFQSALAEITQFILGILGINLGRQGINLIDYNVTYIVTQDCLGWKSMSAYTALIFSSTKKYRKHVKPLLLGLVGIVAINIIRIVTTIYLSHIGLISFEIVHTLFWKWGLTFFVLIIWLWFLNRKSGKTTALGNL